MRDVKEIVGDTTPKSASSPDQLDRRKGGEVLNLTESPKIMRRVMSLNLSPRTDRASAKVSGRQSQIGRWSDDSISSHLYLRDLVHLSRSRSLRPRHTYHLSHQLKTCHDPPRAVRQGEYRLQRDTLIIYNESAIFAPMRSSKWTCGRAAPCFNTVTFGRPTVISLDIIDVFASTPAIHHDVQMRQ